MSNVVDHQPKLKHYCRVCKKGFGCGRALGGHMRSHGIGGEGNGNIEDEEEEEEEEDDDEEEDECVGSDWEEKVGGNQSPGGSKRMYALRTKTNRLKNCKPCENCGKEFSSSKSFLKHEKCSSVDDESLLSSKGSDEEDNADEDGGVAPRERYGWSKGKRSRRAKLGNSSTPNCIPSSEDEDLANCLVMLSNAAHRKVMVDQLVTVAETEESCASASKEAEEDRRKPPTGLGSSTMLTTTTTTTTNRLSNIEQHYKQNGKGISSTTNIKGMFECKACKKVFNSHQALGGHRASHKKVKGCFASKIEDNNIDETLNTEEDVITNEDFSIPTKSTTQPLLSMDHLNHHQQSSSTSYKKKSKVHECSICHRIFSSGQALGGHKRCHWLTSSNSTENSSIINKFQFQDQPSRTTQIQNLNHHINQILPNLSDQPKLDLNLPAPIDDHNVTSTIGSSIIRHEICRPRLSFEMPTDIYLQPWNIQNKDHLSIENNKRNSLSLDDDHQDNIDDRPEDIKKMKLSKLRDIKDINMGGATSSGGATGGNGGGGSFTWLQMGIGSSTSNP